jgi:hypothetical protein
VNYEKESPPVAIAAVDLTFCFPAITGFLWHNALEMLSAQTDNVLENKNRGVSTPSG